MKLNAKNIDDFRLLYKKHFGEEISESEAQKLGMSLLTFIKANISLAQKQK